MLDSLAKNPIKIGNIKNYLLTMLYNSYCTYHNDAAAYVNHVMNGEDGSEKENQQPRDNSCFLTAGQDDDREVDG